jgi:hypothetical protein
MASALPNAATSASAATPPSAAISPRWPAAIFWIGVLILLPLMVLASHDFGMTWDEADRHENGQVIVEYYQGKRPREQAHYGTMYPGLFDVIPAWLEPHASADRYVLRHRVNAVFGWIGIVFTGLLAGRLFGPWCAIVAAVLLAVSPRYVAHSMNNPKDLPFAAMSVVVLYCLARLSPRWPYVTTGAGAALAVSLGLALGTRPGALLYFGYTPLVVLALVLLARIRAAKGLGALDWHIDWKAAAGLSLRVGLVLAAGLLVGTLFWPWAQGAPFTRPIEALYRASGYDWEGLVLFDGEARYTHQLPWSYLPTWFLIATPPVVLAGLVLSIVARVRGWGPARVALWSVGLLPVALILVRDSNVYDGMRHVLFIYPPLVAVAASGWMAVLTSRSAWVRAGAVAVLIPGMATLIAFHVRSYPNQAAYVNELAGGPRGALGRYELDYWGNCLLQAVEWSAEAGSRANMDVIVWGEPWHIIRTDAARFPNVTVVRTLYDPHHLHVQLVRDLADVQRMSRRGDALYRVTTDDGAVLCAVYPGSRYRELRQRLPAARPVSP